MLGKAKYFSSSQEASICTKTRISSLWSFHLLLTLVFPPSAFNFSKVLLTDYVDHSGSSNSNISWLFLKKDKSYSIAEPLR